MASALGVEARELRSAAVAVEQKPRIRHRLIAQQIHKLLVGAKAVNQQRQAVFAREGEVSAKHAKLPVHGRKRGRSSIQAALANGNGDASAKQLIQACEVSVVFFRGELRQQLRVDAQAHLHPGLGKGQLEQRLPSRGANSRNEQALHPGQEGALEHQGAIAVKAGSVEVAVRVDHRHEG